MRSIDARKWLDRAVLSRLRDNRRGNVAIIAAIAMTPMLIAIAGVIELSMRVSTTDVVQTALDTATLAAGKASTDDPQQLLAITQATFAANVAHTMASDATIDANNFQYDPTQRALTVTATGPFHDALSGIEALGNQTYSVSNKVFRQSDTNVEIALVLDNTYSMSQPAPGDSVAKIDSLKSSATILADTLMSRLAGIVKIAVVPYTDRVNVGKLPTNGAAWLNIPSPYLTCTFNGMTTIMPPTPENKAKCRAQSMTRLVCPPVQVTCPTLDGVVQTGPCYSTPATCPVKIQQTVVGYWLSYQFWGCVLPLSDSNGNLKMPDPSKFYDGKLDTAIMCSQQILPLTDNKTQVDSEISGMYTSINNYYGNTYIPEGLVWGVNVLSPGEPYTQGLPFDPANRSPHKVLILMTDGANDEVLDSTGTLRLAKAANPIAKTYREQDAACNSAKGKKIEVYTIGFGLDTNAPADQQALAALQSCATDASHYFDAKNAQQLLAAFNQIASKMSELRIAG